MKKEIRILGIDDSPFDKFNDKEVLVVGVFYRGGNYPDGIMSTKVTVDGDDATVKLIEMINISKFKSQLQCIMLDGIALGGFNVVNIERLSKETKIPVIVVMRNYPNFEKIKIALEKLNYHDKVKLIEKAGKPYKVEKIHIQIKGISLEDAKKVIKISAIHSDIPEPIRVAHLIGAGLVKGESKGNA